MADATDFEQMMVELINSARMNPQADFARYITDYDTLTSNDDDIQSAFDFFGVVGSTLKSQVDALTSVAPVAWNSTLNEVATTHSDLMIEEDEQSHQLPGELSIGDRISAAGYDYSRVGENVYAFTENPLYGHAGFMVDWGFGPDGIQDPAGHRNSIMSSDFAEIGIGVVAESDPGTDVGPFVVTQNFGTRLFDAPEAILLGVVFDDGDNDDFYSLGEGAGSISVSISGGGSDTTPDSGGFAIETSAGDKTVTFSGDALADDITVTATLEAENAKIDLIDGLWLRSSVDLNLGDNARHAELYGLNNLQIIGNGEKNKLLGNAGKNKLKGGDGKDTLQGRDGNDKLDGGKGNDSIKGGAGKDRIEGHKGNDILTGNKGKDKFDYDQTNWGSDRITDWEDGKDKLDFKGTDLAFEDFDFTQQDDDVLVTADGASGTILIENALEGDFSAADFLF